MAPRRPQPTTYPAVNAMLALLVSDVRRSLGPRLVGLYLIGSALTEDFDEGVSDLDLVAVLSDEPHPDDLPEFDAIHHRFVERHGDWAGRLEVVYVSEQTLRSPRGGHGQLAVISPGEPLSLRPADSLWLLRWYLVRETGVTLHGRSADSVVPPIDRRGFVDVVKEHARRFPAWIEPGTPGSLVRHETLGRRGQAYAILAMCRALYACRTGEQSTKRQAALWAQEQLPEWSTLIGDALRWRRAPDDADGAATFARTKAFVTRVAELTASLT
jgi:Aminoglycoside adenylyltransferase, C-terminal domain